MVIKIGIIGAGNVGRALAKASVRAGHTVTITATDAEEAGHVAADVGAKAAASNAEAVAAADVVILAVPFDAVQGIATELGARLDGKVLSLGFRPIDSDPLAMARALEGMGMLNIALNMAHGWPWQTGWKLLGPTG